MKPRPPRRCRCGAELERDPRARARLGGDLLEYLTCEACHSTTCVLVETCGHARAEAVGDAWRCVECGHAWRQVGAVSPCELYARNEARARVEWGI